MIRLAPLLLLALAGCDRFLDAEGLCKQGDSYLLRKRYDWAIEVFEMALKKEPELPEAWYGLGVAKERKARRLAAKKEDDAALKLYYESVEDKRKARELMSDGKAKLWTAKRFDEARSDIDATLYQVDDVGVDEDALLRDMHIRSD